MGINFHKLCYQLSEGEKISQVIVRHGYIVDALGVNAAKPNASSYRVRFGGILGQESKVCMID